jgi:PKHD-type hydroxylase
MAWLFHLDTVENWAYADNVFTPEECDKIKRIALAKNKEKANVIGKDQKGEINTSIRNNSVVWLNEKDDLSWVYERLSATVMHLNKEFFKFDLFGFCEDLQFTEYKGKGEHYKQHIDKIYNGASRKLSIVVQLTDPKEYKGGELELYDGRTNVMKKNQGSLFAFPSYTLHQVNPLVKGTRHSLVAWIAGPNFK